MSSTTPSDPCGRCGCQRQAHKPDKTFTKSKFRIHAAGSAHKDSIEIRARTCCDKCEYCICFCTAFVEPFEGQPYKECIYARANLPQVQHPEAYAHQAETEAGRDSDRVLSGVQFNRKARRAKLQRG